MRTSLRSARALLVVGVIGLVAGCYSPQIESCQLRCDRPADCPHDFACRSGVCVEGSATTCPAIPDAATPADGTSADAGPGAARLRLEIEGRGSLVVTPGDRTCTDREATCTFDYSDGDMVTIEARVTQAGKPFEGWTSGPCVGSRDNTCRVTVTAPQTVVGAKFKN